MKTLFFELATWAIGLYVVLSVVSVSLSYLIRRIGYLGLNNGRGSVSPKYTKWMWEHLYDAKSVSVPDKSDRTFSLVKVLFRIFFLPSLIFLGPLLMVTTILDCLNFIGIRLPRRVPEGGFDADKSYPPLAVAMGVSDEGHR